MFASPAGALQERPQGFRCGNHWLHSFAADVVAEAVLPVDLLPQGCCRIGNLHCDEIQGFSRVTPHGTKDTAFAGRQGDKDDIVLTATHPFSLVFQYCNDGEGYISNPDRLTQAWSSIEKLLNDAGTHDRHLVPNFQFAFYKRSTAGETPFARDEVVCGNPGHICGPVFASRHDMCGMRKQRC